VTPAPTGLPPQFRLLQIKVPADFIFDAFAECTATEIRDAVGKCDRSVGICIAHVREKRARKRAAETIAMNFRHESRGISFKRFLGALLSRMDGITSRIYLIEHTESTRLVIILARVLLKMINPAGRSLIPCLIPPETRPAEKSRTKFIRRAHTPCVRSRLAVRVSTNPPAVSLMVISFSRKSSIRRPIVPSRSYN